MQYMHSHRMIFLKEVDSTNRYALQHADTEHWEEGTVVWAEHQHKGRGRRNAPWYGSPGKNLYCSLVLRPEFLDLGHQAYLNMALALGVREALEKLSEESVSIKWPNDIIVRDKKIAGLLIQNVCSEGTIRLSVCGIGVNVNEERFPNHLPHAVSLYQLCGKTIPLHTVLSTVLHYAMQYYDQLRDQDRRTALLSTYESHLWNRGAIQRFYDPKTDQIVEAEIRGVDDKGRLRLFVNGAERVLGDLTWKWLYPQSSP